MPKYTFYIVTRSANDHYPVIMANNGKAAFNESVQRAHKLETSFLRLYDACKENLCDADGVEIQRITHAEFKQKFPHYAKNAGRKSNKRK
jgi:hypothetical protein